MLKVFSWFVLLAVAPGVAVAQVVAANSAMPQPAELSGVGEPAMADGLTPQVAGANQSNNIQVATGMLGLTDVQLVYAPQPSQYQPESGPEMAPPSQPVKVACVVGPDGRMQSCSVAADAPHDPKVAELALGDVSQFVVAPTTREGVPAAGQTLVVTCQFQPVDEAGERQDLAAN